MRRILIAAAVLAFAATGARAEGEKVIKDKGEYDAYMAALNMADPAAKAKAMDAFVQAYPSSIVYEDALDQEMAASQAAGDTKNVERVARLVIARDPAHVRALAIVTFLARSRAGNTGDIAAAKAAAEEAGALADKGLAALPAWSRPDGLTDAQYAAVKSQVTQIFTGARAFAALQRRDYAAARRDYAAATTLDPNDLQNAYQYSIALLEGDPPDPAGLWWGAHALGLAAKAGNAAAIQGMSPYLKARYARLHGSEDGWEALVGQAAAERAPPAGFKITGP